MTYSDPILVEAAITYLNSLLSCGIGVIPLPFVAMIEDGGLQFEWNKPLKHLEIEVLENNVIFLQEDLAGAEENIITGECGFDDLKTARNLLKWFLD